MSKASEGGHIGPSLFGPCTVALEGQAFSGGLVVKLTQEGFLNPFANVSLGSQELLDVPLIQVKSQGLSEWESGVNDVLVVEATGFGGRFSSLALPSPMGSPFLSVACDDATGGPCLGLLGSWIQPLNLLLQDGRLVDLTRNATKDSLDEDLEVRVEELEVSKALKIVRVSEEGKLGL